MSVCLLGDGSPNSVRLVSCKNCVSVAEFFENNTIYVLCHRHGKYSFLISRQEIV